MAVRLGYLDGAGACGPGGFGFGVSDPSGALDGIRDWAALNGGANVYDEVIVIADVKVKSTTKLPLFLHDMWGEVTLPNGDVIQSLAASGADYRKVFVAYPALDGQKQTPMSARLHDDPGPGVEGR